MVRDGSSCKQSAETQVRGAAVEQALGRFAEQLFAGPVDQPEFLGAVKSEHGDLNLGHHLAEQRGGFQCGQALLPQVLTERVDLDDDFPQRIFAPPASSPDGVIALPDGRQQIGECLEWKPDLPDERKRAAEPDRRNECHHRPPRLAAILAHPKKSEGRRNRRQARHEGDPENPMLVL